MYLRHYGAANIVQILSRPLPRHQLYFYYHYDAPKPPQTTPNNPPELPPCHTHPNPPTPNHDINSTIFAQLLVKKMPILTKKRAQNGQNTIFWALRPIFLDSTAKIRILSFWPNFDQNGHFWPFLAKKVSLAMCLRHYGTMKKSVFELKNSCLCS